MSETKGSEVQDRVVMELFRDYFEADGDVTSYSTLIRVAEKAGLDPAEVEGWLEGGQGGEQVDSEVQRAREKNVTGVPSFIIQDKYEVDGAQDEQDFLEMFVKVKEAEAKAA
jgi:predicted DsbA family dithiol-disulfide isomerase